MSETFVKRASFNIFLQDKCVVSLSELGTTVLGYFVAVLDSRRVEVLNCLGY